MRADEVIQLGELAPAVDGFVLSQRCSIEVIHQGIRRAPVEEREAVLVEAVDQLERRRCRLPSSRPQLVVSSPDHGIVETQYIRRLIVTPGVGFAWDLTGAQNIALRRGAGLFADRPTGNAVYSIANNVPSLRNVTVRYGQLQS